MDEMITPPRKSIHKCFATGTRSGYLERTMNCRMVVGTGVCKIFEFGKEWTCWPWDVGSAIIKCSSFGRRMNKRIATIGAEHRLPAIIKAPSMGPKSPSRSPSRNPAAMRTTNWARTHRRITIPSMRPTLLHLDSDSKWDVDDAIEPCMDCQVRRNYMKGREGIPLSSPITRHGNSSRLRALIIAGLPLWIKSNKASPARKQFLKN